MSNWRRTLGNYDPPFVDWLFTVEGLCQRMLGRGFERIDPVSVSAREHYERGLSPEQFLEYIEWYLRADDLCVRYLHGCGLAAFYDFDPEHFDAESYFEEGWTPAEFFVHVVVELLRDEYPDIDTLIGIAWVWGKTRRPVIQRPRMEAIADDWSDPPF
jgi:hypothetical protein